MSGITISTLIRFHESPARACGAIGLIGACVIVIRITGLMNMLSKLEFGVPH